MEENWNPGNIPHVLMNYSIFYCLAHNESWSSEEDEGSSKVSSSINPDEFIET